MQVGHSSLPPCVLGVERLSDHPGQWSTIEFNDKVVIYLRDGSADAIAVEPREDNYAVGASHGVIPG